MTTWDIIRNYMALTDEEMEAIVPTIDDPSNGISFEPNCRDSFDEFSFSLHATEVSHLVTCFYIEIRVLIFFRRRTNTRYSSIIPNSGSYSRVHLREVASIISFSRTTATRIRRSLCTIWLTFVFTLR